MKDQIEEQDARLRRYLLGELSDEDQQQIEERLLVDNDYVEQMLIAEEDLIDDYLNGALPPSQRETYQKRFPATREGQQKIQAARALKNHLNKFQTPEPAFMSRFLSAIGGLFSPPVLKFATALLVVGVGVLNWTLFFRQTDLKKGMVALTEAYKEQRPIEARITGLPYAPFPGAGSSHAQTNKVKLSAVDSAFHKLSEKSPTPASLHVLGKYFLTEKNFDEAVKHLEEGLKAAPDNAPLHVDLAVALMERGKATNSQADFDNSRQHLLEATKLDPASLEARFNLGLLFQNRQSWKDAEESWRQYLLADSSSPWAAEAKRYLNLIETQKK